MGESALSKDVTTGIFTQSSFEYLLNRKLELAEANAENIGLLLLDPDDLAILSTQEERAVDILMKEVALRLKSCLRASDVIAHFEGNQFAIILDEIENPDAPARVARKIIQSLGCSYPIDRIAIELSCSVGIACASPFEVNDVQLVKRAQKALANAKAEGGYQFHYYIEFLDRLSGK